MTDQAPSLPESEASVPLSKLVRYVAANQRLSRAGLARERAENEYREADLEFRAMWHDLTPAEQRALNGLVGDASSSPDAKEQP